MGKKRQNKADKVERATDAADGDTGPAAPAKLGRKAYEREMRRLHGELVAMQEWVKATGAKVCNSSAVHAPVLPPTKKV